MGRNRFVPVKKKRIDISDGDWIDAKEQLNIGEQLDVEGAGIEVEQRGDRDAVWKLSSAREAAVARVATWLADWSLCDGAGKKVILSRNAVGRLDAETFGEIRDALDTHIKSMGSVGVDESTKKDESAGEQTDPKN